MSTTPRRCVLVAAPMATTSGNHDSIGLPRPNSPRSKAGAFFSPLPAQPCRRVSKAKVSQTDHRGTCLEGGLDASHSVGPVDPESSRGGFLYLLGPRRRTRAWARPRPQSQHRQPREGLDLPEAAGAVRYAVTGKGGKSWPGAEVSGSLSSTLVRNVRFAKAWCRSHQMRTGASCTSALRASIERPMGSLKLNMASGRSEIDAQPSCHRIESSHAAASHDRHGSLTHEV